MSLRFRHHFRIGRRSSILWSVPLTGGNRGQNGWGCLTLVLVGIGGFLNMFSGHSTSSTPSPRSAQHQTADEPKGLKAGQPSASKQVTSSPSAVLMTTETTKPAPPGSLQKVDPKELFTVLNLGSRGFTSNDHSRETPSYWTYRRTDADREYTAVVLGGNKGIQAVTAELVSSTGSTIDQAKSYFSTFAGQLITPDYREAVTSWVAATISSSGSHNFGDVTVTLSHVSSFHQRITFVQAP